VNDDADLEAWAGGLDGLFAQVAGRFLRAEPRRRARAYVRGLLAPLAGKNGWTLAEVAGDATRDGMQRLLNSAHWDTDGVRDDVRGYVVEHLGDPAGVLIVDETGFLKKGLKSAGVQRQYSGTAGRVENCQLGVFLAYATGKGRTLIDRELYLPKSWTADRDRCRAAAIGDDVEFATKAVLAQQSWAAPWTPGCPRPGWPRTRPTGRTTSSAPGANAAASATSWPCRAARPSPPAPDPAAPITPSPVPPSRPGSG
jgi:SRSO17 transposase